MSVQFCEKGETGETEVYLKDRRHAHDSDRFRDLAQQGDASTISGRRVPKGEEIV